MTEPPDFQQIARQIAAETGVGRLEEWDAGDPDRVMTAIINALRHAWNARGAADLDAMETAHTNYNWTELEDAIRELDR